MKTLSRILTENQTVKTKKWLEKITRSHFLVKHTLEVEVNVIVVVIYFVIGLYAIYTIESLFYANVDILWFFAGSRLVKCSSSSTGKFVFMSILWVSFTATFWALHLKGGMPVATVFKKLRQIEAAGGSLSISWLLW